MLRQVIEVGGRMFPDRTVAFASGPTSRQVSVPGSVQAAIALAIILGVGSSGLVAVRSHLHAEAAAEAREQNLRALQARLDAAEKDAAAAREAAEAAQRQLIDLAGGEAAAEAETAEQLGQRIGEHLAALEAQVHNATRQEQALDADRSKLASEKGKLQSTVGQLRDQERKVTAEMQQTVVSATTERNQLRQRLGELEKRLRKVSSAAPPAATPDAVQLAEADGEEGASTPIAVGNGFDLDGFLARYGLGKASQRNVGGPFIAAGAIKQSVASPETAAVLRTLPLAAPLDSYRLESGFGVRIDPINHRRSVHSGLDFSAPYLSPVHCTAPGEVVFAGWSAGYGKLVEIDHGNGFHTKYGHLNRLLVNVGEHVGKHATVGLLGSTGRSTGPHVHYEVLVNGVAQNPIRFLDAGKSIVGASE